jgi:hypothetical protein
MDDYKYFDTATSVVFLLKSGDRKKYDIETLADNFGYFRGQLNFANNLQGDIELEDDINFEEFEYVMDFAERKGKGVPAGKQNLNFYNILNFIDYYILDEKIAQKLVTLNFDDIQRNWEAVEYFVEYMNYNLFDDKTAERTTEAYAFIIEAKRAKKFNSYEFKNVLGFSFESQNFLLFSRLVEIFGKEFVDKIIKRHPYLIDYITDNNLYDFINFCADTHAELFPTHYIFKLFQKTKLTDIELEIAEKLLSSENFKIDEYIDEFDRNLTQTVSDRALKKLITSYEPNTIYGDYKSDSEELDDEMIEKFNRVRGN